MSLPIRKLIVGDVRGATLSATLKTLPCETDRGSPHLARKNVKPGHGSWENCQRDRCRQLRPLLALVLTRPIRLAPVCVTSASFWHRQLRPVLGTLLRDTSILQFDVHTEPPSSPPRFEVM